MFSISPAHWLAALPVVAMLPALAQPVPDPARPPWSVIALPYESALDGYQPFRDEKPTPWRDANETVHRRGGWRAYAQDPSTEAAPAAAPQGADAHSAAGHPMPMPAKEKKP